MRNGMVNLMKKRKPGKKLGKGKNVSKERKLGRKAMTDKTESIRLGAGRLEMPLADRSLVVTPYGEDCVFVGAEL